MPVPNYIEHVRRARDRWPEAWAAAHRGGDDTELFIRLLCSWLYHEVDQNVRLNGKYANTADLADDGLSIVHPDGDNIDLDTRERFFFFDVIAGAGGPNPQPAWQHIVPKTIPGFGRNLVPPRIHDSVGTPEPPPSGGQPPATPTSGAWVPYRGYVGDQAYDAIGRMLEDDYHRAGQLLNGGAIVWLARVMHDSLIGEAPGRLLTLEQALAKHRPTWLSVLGEPRPHPAAWAFDILDRYAKGEVFDHQVLREAAAAVQGIVPR